MDDTSRNDGLGQSADVSRPPGDRPARRSTGPAYVAAVLAIGAVGLLIISLADYFARTGTRYAMPTFWAGFLCLVVPTAWRATRARTGRGERIAELLIFGLLLYGVKVIYAPIAFTFADELVHLANLQQIFDLGRLFPHDSILPVTTQYPGLEAFTAGFAHLSGLSLFSSGLIVIGAARLVLMACLFLLFELLSGSPRVASLATLVYATNPNFVFWSAQFSYESLALPLFALALVLALLRQGRGGLDGTGAFTLPAVVAIAAVVMTHHVTGMGLVVVLMLIAALASLRPDQMGRAGRVTRNGWDLVGLAGAMVVTWLLAVAPLATGYLSAIFVPGGQDFWHTLSGTSSPRQIFGTNSGVPTYPAVLRALSIVSILIVAAVIPFGLRRAIKMRPRDLVALTLCFSAVFYLVALPLRLIPAAWEAANRSGDFLYIGISLAIALAATWHLLRRRFAVSARVTTCGLFAILAIGGVCIGWPPNALLSGVLQARLGGRTTSPQGYAAAAWVREAIGPRHRFVSDSVNGRLLLTYAGELPWAGPDGRARTILEPPSLTSSVISEIRQLGVSYVVVDRRVSSDDVLTGYFFPPPGDPPIGATGFIAAGRITKFNVPSVDRIFDSGDIVIYDVRRITP